MREKMNFEILARKNFNKIFNIGYNKTGTTTMEYVFKKLGYSCPDQQEQEARIVKQLYLGNFKPLIDFVAQYDAFQDMPFSQGVVYSQVDALFPNSKFILTVRNKDDWYESLVRFQTNGLLKNAEVDNIDKANEVTFKNKNLYLYNNYIYENKKRQVSFVLNYKVEYDWSLLYCKEHLLELYESRNNEIIKYFQNRPDDLLIIDIEKEKDISKILSFLNLPQEFNFDLPHLNRTK
jgi:hypothetical protein